MLKDIGAHYIIIGHSERRTYHGESDELVAEKFAVLKKLGLTPVLCIGESEAENEAGKTEEVCARQIDAVLNTQGADAFLGAVIAYEPIWLSAPANPPPLHRHRQSTNLSAAISRRKMRKWQSRLLSSTAVL